MNTSQAKRRLAGRPGGESDGLQQRSILDAAEALFAAQGYAATPLREIAQHAGVNPALIHYYWGSKSGLLRAVMDEAFEPLAEAMAGFSESGEGVDAFTTVMYRLLMERPNLPALILREVFLTQGDIRDLFIREYAPRLGGALAPLLQNMQAEGQVRQDLDPGSMALLIISLCLFPAVARPVAAPVLGIDYSREGMEGLLRHVNSILKSGIES